MITNINGVKVFAYRIFHSDKAIFDKYIDYAKSHPKAPAVYGRLLDDRRTIKVEYRHNTLTSSFELLNNMKACKPCNPMGRHSSCSGCKWNKQ